MTRTIRILCSLLLVLAVAAPAVAQPGSLKLPPYKKVVLKNGMTLLLMEQHEVPLVSFSVLVKAGSVSDPAGKEGVASMTAALLRKGTATRSADEFSAQLDFIGGSFGAGASADATVMSAEFMKKDLAKGLELVADAMLHPSFPGDEVQKLAAQRVDGIKSAKDRAAGVIGQYFNAYLYGKHPYGRPTGGDEASLASITRDDVAEVLRGELHAGRDRDGRRRRLRRRRHGEAAGGRVRRMAGEGRPGRGRGRRAGGEGPASCCSSTSRTPRRRISGSATSASRDRIPTACSSRSSTRSSAGVSRR